MQTMLDSIFNFYKKAITTYSSRDPSWLPDGTKIAFVFRTIQNFDIYCIPFRDNIYDFEEDFVPSPVRVTNTSMNCFRPSWSPDGKLIAFEAQNREIRSIYIHDYYSSVQHRLTGNSTQSMCPSWSPDGKRITYTSSLDGEVYHLYLMSFDGTDQVCLIDNMNCCFSTWSPDGKQIAFVKLDIHNKENEDIFVVDILSRKQRRLTNGGRCVRLSWSPDSKQIAFERSDLMTDKDYKESKLKAHIYAINSDGTNERLLSTTLGFMPSWSPDGKRIAFCSYTRPVAFEVYVMDINGSNLRRLTKS
jgi:TolB protein